MNNFLAKNKNNNLFINMIIIQNIKEKLTLGHNSYQSFYDVNNNMRNSLYSNGSEFWYKNGKKHRDNDLPAVIDSNGKKLWYRDGELHRDGDKPTIIGDNDITMMIVL